MNALSPVVALGAHPVGGGAPCFVIAELGVNHNGDVDMALRLIDAAAEAGAQAVKLQTFSSDRLVAPSAAKAPYQRTSLDDGSTQHAMLSALELDHAAHERLQRHAQSRGLLFLSTPFDEASADMLESLDVPAFKLSSGDLTHLPLLRHIAAKGRPMLLSTGMATIAEVSDALDAVAAAGDPPVILFHCVSAYPADPADSNLQAMQTLRRSFNRPVGWSDHTTDPAVCWAAVALGAEIVEKHLTLDRTLPGPDHSASADPQEFRRYVQGIRTVEGALGDGRKAMRKSEHPIAAVARRSLVAITDVRRGQRLGDGDVGVLRPGSGLRPALLSLVLGRTAAADIAAGTVLTLEMLT